jgi:hypothetical protein
MCILRPHQAVITKLLHSCASAAAVILCPACAHVLPHVLSAGSEVLCVLADQRALQDPAHPEVSSSCSSSSSRISTQLAGE